MDADTILKYKEYIRRNKNDILAKNGANNLAGHYVNLSILCKKVNDYKQSEYFTRMASATLRRSREAILEQYSGPFNEALATGKISRSHVKYLWDGKSPIRVTFISGRGDLRVMRLAAAAKSAGIQTQLIIRTTGKQHNDLVDESLFEKVLWFGALPYDLPEIIKAIDNFGSHLVHCHMELDFNQAGVWLLTACDLPFVGDAYDMVNAQYIPEHDWNKNWYPAQSKWEKVWYENAEGICFRSPYRKHMERRGIFFRKDALYTLTQEPILSSCINERSPEVNKPCKVLLEFFGDHTEKWFQRFEQCSLDTSNFEFSTIQYGPIDDLPKPTFCTIHPFLPHKDWLQLIRSTDVFINVPFESFPGVRPSIVQDVRKDLSSNHYIECLEAGMILVLPKEYTFPYNYNRKTNRVIRCDGNEFESSEFWKSLPGRISKLRSKKADFSYCNEIAIGRKLYNFYVRILKKSHQ